ncbi:hypothetical protein CC1G_10530 [Coprinopsis cinerea okayama7|uniref:Uncharacterized protein n=1 Tax=Coprinopsis cinerea (strain Okayama-7 / 130 / ATCC MYA-4618 / FGSC 9003) TaxID=240176 RepID=A8N1A9_COPC7|nr:hypothetical protein CC1G_10530 [Coprinopsis cinerea okayama7\|eukprot:XP_001828658.2 hypothetical protein CC1G_10530 [Coprinopsis cinerea okayama7\
MSDSTGITAGGITRAMRVGAAQGGAECDTVDPGADFFYSLDGELAQCSDYPFTNYGRAVQPVTIFGFVPGGLSFAVQPPPGDSFDWRATIPAGTQIAFFMTDAEGRNGGTSAIQTASSSSDASCLPLSSAPVPSSTRSASETGTRSSATRQPTASGIGDSSDNQDEDNDEKKDGPNVGIIVGAAAGGFVFLGIFAFLAVFCFKRNKSSPSPPQEGKSFTDYGTGGSVLPVSPSNTYLLPSTLNSSSANIAPSQAAAPYPQNTYSTNGSHTPLIKHASPNPTVNSSFPAQQAEYNPYTADEMGGYGGYGSSSATQGGPGQYNDSSGNLYGGSAATGYPPQPMATGVAAAGAYGYGQYSGYQQGHQQYQHGQQPYHQDHCGQTSNPYPPAQGHHRQGSHPYAQSQHSYQHNQYHQHPQHGYNPASASSYAPSRTTGTLYATNADPAPSSVYSASSQGTQRPQASGSGEKSVSPPSAPSQRLIVHQDIEETMDLPDELPPQYSESRAPIPGLPGSQPTGDRKR